jgi:hypothetical protein
MSNCRLAFYKSVLENEYGCDKEARRVTLDLNDHAQINCLIIFLPNGIIGFY